MPLAACSMAAAASKPDLFDGILMAEERFHGEGYQDGYAEGNRIGVTEGRIYGSLHGARIGSEVGCYLGFALTWQHLLHNCTGEKHSKKLKALESLVGMIQKFPYEDPTYDKLQEDLEKIRGKFKQVCSMLNTHPDFRIGLERSVLTF
ncbi:protein LTO1 homolog isoform X1 [Alligator mississippiensis]|nr:protein LTO1 homolog isoform X1 [Alligator mississippiensis]